MDLNVRAFRVVQAAISEQAAPTVNPRKDASRKGGLRGGASRALSISSERRSEIARKASRARWQKQP